MRGDLGPSIPTGTGSFHNGYCQPEQTGMVDSSLKKADQSLACRVIGLGKTKMIFGAQRYIGYRLKIELFQGDENSSINAKREGRLLVSKLYLSTTVCLAAARIPDIFSLFSRAQTILSAKASES